MTTAVTHQSSPIPLTAHLASCLPNLPDVDWGRVAASLAFCIGVGTVMRPLAELLAYFGVRQFYLVDPKNYRDRSIASQCESADVARPKSVVVAERLARLGVQATPLVADVCEIEPGYVAPGAVVIASTDNRRADIGAARLAAMMQARFMKVNIEPLYLIASIRCYDFRSPDYAVCPECQLTDEQYRNQRHPRSCDGDAGRPTGSPRALSYFAASAAAMAYVQLVGSDRWATEWYGREWQKMLLGGRGSSSNLAPGPDCRWEHGRHWKGLERLQTGPAETTLGALLDRAAWRGRNGVELRFSGELATRGVCDRCGRKQEVVQWMRSVTDAVGRCDCGASLAAVPYYACQQVPADRLAGWLDRPLADWGVPPYAIVALERDGEQKSFVIGERGTR